MKISLKDYEINDLKKKLMEQESQNTKLQEQIDELTKLYEEKEQRAQTQFDVTEAKLKDQITQLEKASKKDFEIMTKENMQEQKNLWD